MPIVNQDADNDLKTYIKCMITPGGSAACYQIECRHGLDGYAPDAAMVGLKAISEGREPHAEIESYYRDSHI